MVRTSGQTARRRAEQCWSHRLRVAPSADTVWWRQTKRTNTNTHGARHPPHSNRASNFVASFRSDIRRSSSSLRTWRSRTICSAPMTAGDRCAPQRSAQSEVRGLCACCCGCGATPDPTPHSESIVQSSCWSRRRGVGAISGQNARATCCGRRSGENARTTRCRRRGGGGGRQRRVFAEAVSVRFAACQVVCLCAVALPAFHTHGAPASCYR